jgi:hypothetical protein
MTMANFVHQMFDVLIGPLSNAAARDEKLPTPGPPEQGVSRKRIHAINPGDMGFI